MKELEDNEIRIIGSPAPQPRHGRWWVAVLVILVIVVIVALVLGKTSREETLVESQPTVSEEIPATPVVEMGDCLTVIDTLINDVPLTLYLVDNAKASLQIGLPDVEDTTMVLAVLAADIRADNGGIVGDFIIDGRVMARGERKEGYCAISEGIPTFGRGGEGTLERVQKGGGDFFRQYMLVDDGHAVPPKPKGKNHRRALCRMGHQIFVAASGDRESYHDFATALADLGVKDAIALVGSESLLMYRAEGGLLHSVGTAMDSPNINFIVWRR